MLVGKTLSAGIFSLDSTRLRFTPCARFLI
jgi:hypothetical protein